MTDPTPNDLSPQGVPNNSARCLGSGSYEDGKWHWREGCDDCQRRYGWAGGWIEPPPIIAFECEYRIGPDKNAAQREHASRPEPLSPAAQAIWTAYETADCDPYLVDPRKAGIAAAIRALANQSENLYDPHEGKVSVVRTDDLLTIATELEGHEK